MKFTMTQFTYKKQPKTLQHLTKFLVLTGSKWRSHHLTWCIYDSDLSPDMSRDGQIDAIRNAFQV